MAKTSLYKISEQCRVITDKRVSIQVLLEAVKNAYAAVAKKQFYDNTTFDSTELNGSFIYTFPKVVPEFDCDRDMWYLTIPSSYLELPQPISPESQTNWIDNVIYLLQTLDHNVDENTKLGDYFANG